MNVADLFKAAIAAEPPGQMARPRFSKMGEPCMRRLVYDLRLADAGLPENRGFRTIKGVLASAIGTVVHQVLQRGCVAMGHEVEKPAEFDTGHVRITGSLDWRVPGSMLTGEEIPANSVGDFKIVSDKKWSKIQARPDPAHVMQVNGYALADDAPTWFILYLRGGSFFEEDEDWREPKIDYLVHAGPTDIELAKDGCHTWEEVQTHRVLNTLPERPFGATPERWPCLLCPHAKTVCFTEEKAS